MIFEQDRPFYGAVCEVGGAAQGEREGFVDYCTEDHTHARDQIEATINERLEALAQKMSPTRVL